MMTATRLAYLITPMAALGLAAGACTATAPDYRGDIESDTQLVQYQSCSALEADLKSMLVAEMETRFDQMAERGGGGFGTDDAADPSSGGESDGGGREEGEDYSGTNNQEDGVDEADFVKTDGYHVYVLNGNELHIFGVPEFGDLVPASSVPVEGIPRQMLLSKDADKVVVFSNVYPETLPEDHPLFDALGDELHGDWYWRSGHVSKLTVFDVSDKTRPELERELFFEGYYQTARMVDTSVRLGSYSWLNVPGLWDWYWYYYDSDNDIERARRRARAAIMGTELADLIPRIYERDPDGELTAHGLDEESCRSFFRPQNSHARGITSVLSFDVTDTEFDFDADHVVSNWPTLYASQDVLVLAEPANDWWWYWWNEDQEEKLNLHLFDIGTPGQSEYLASGRVDGVLHDQFSLDEQDGYLRVATTSNFWNRWWLEDPPESDNHVFVLERSGADLDVVGHVDGIARGERIFAARMIGDRGYLVTFRQIDPLFTLDLSDPHDPQVVGELEIPGFSTYIHPIENDKLLTIGVGGDDNGANWRTQISMFDVSDFANPSLFDVEELVREGSWGWSEAMYEHKAFQYWAPEGLLAVPLSSSRWDGDTYEHVSNLELISVDTGQGLSHHGSIDHSHFYDSDQSWYYLDIRRSIFMGDYVYAISDRGITAHALDDLTKVAEQPLPGHSPNDWYWWW